MQLTIKIPKSSGKTTLVDHAIFLLPVGCNCLFWKINTMMMMMTWRTYANAAIEH